MPRDEYSIGAFRMFRYKRSTDRRKWKINRVSKDSYQLLTEKDARTTFGVIISGMKKILQKLLNRQKTSKS